MKTSLISIKDVIKIMKAFCLIHTEYYLTVKLGGSIELINHLNKINYNYFILTNDSSITDKRSKILLIKD